MRISLIILLTLILSDCFGQIFTESMGTVGGTTAIATHETANGFDNDPYLMTGTADLRATTVSSGYAGASGGANVFITNTVGIFFQIETINTSGCTITSITHGMFKSIIASNGSELICEVSSDGISYTALTASVLPTGAGTATWHLRTCTGAIPSTANLRIRFRQTSTTPQFRVDDVKLNGTCVTPENCSDGIDNDGDGLIDAADPDCSSNTITTGVISGSPFVISCSVFKPITVPFTTTGTYNAGNIFTAQLSDATGSFSFPLIIGTLSLSGTGVSGNIPSTILAGLTSGAAYRIRVVSSNPATTGSDNGINLTVTNAGSPCNGPLIVNEVSQGSTGTQEYIEVLVVGNNPCATIDIRNMIIDDNNGDFSGGPVASTGIANGHLRFSNSSQWSNVPSGSLIVIYNNADINPLIPADDVSDLLVPNKVYILPANSSFLEGCSTLPIVGNSLYSPCTYGAGVWTYIGLANAADAAQTRFSNGNYDHGVSWGASPMNGGPNALNIGTTSAAGQLVEFENTIDNDYTNAANFTRSNAPTDETPGAANSVNNAVYISTLTCLTLPVELLRFNLARISDDAMLTWVTGSEKNCWHFIIERASTDMEFVPIGKVDGNGTTNQIHEYAYLDTNPLNGLSYYRLRQVDFDGKFEYSSIKPFQFENSALNKSIFNGSSLILEGCNIDATIQVFNTAGSLLLSKKGQESVSLEELAAGYYIVRIICGSQYFNLPISKPQ